MKAYLRRQALTRDLSCQMRHIHRLKYLIRHHPPLRCSRGYDTERDLAIYVAPCCGVGGAEAPVLGLHGGGEGDDLFDYFEVVVYVEGEGVG